MLNLFSLIKGVMTERPTKSMSVAPVSVQKKRFSCANETGLWEGK